MDRYRAKFCAKCGRVIKQAGLCEDCEAMLGLASRSGCSFCGKSLNDDILYYNEKRRKTYCTTCLEVFKATMKHSGFTDSMLMTILKEDFLRLN